MSDSVKKINHPTHDENYWVMVLLYFASFLIGLGIIAVTAANWRQIPDSFKLIGALVAMAANAGVLTWAILHQKHILKQVVSCIYAFLIMAVIGLIGQIFRLPSDITDSCLLWSCVSWPLFLVTPRLLWLWLPLFFCGTRCLNLEALWQNMFDNHLGMWFSHPEISLKTNDILTDMFRNFSVFALFIGYELWLNIGDSQNKSIKHPLFFFSGLMMYLLYGNIVKAAYAFPTAENAKLILAITNLLPCLLVGIGIYLLNRTYGRRSFMPLFLLGALIEFAWVIIMQNNNIGTIPSVHLGQFSEYPFEMSCPLIFLGILTWYTSYHNVDPRDRAVCLIAFGLWFIITFGEDVFALLPFLIICSLAAWLAYKADSRKWFNTAVLAAVIRILAFYADVSDLQHAGIYLIGSGILLIAVILVLMKYGNLLWEKKDEQ